uniref:Uncharacterized protein n=2 Tax=Cyprinus carpio TaxID=7962 RepID=A0A8C1ACC0_CYPCA
TIWDTGHFGVYKNPAQHVPLQEFTENLKDIEKECLLKGSSLNRLNSVVGQYVQACVQAARQSGVDNTNSFFSPKDFSVYLSDGLHLSDKGNQFVAEHFWTLLERRVTDLPFILAAYCVIKTQVKWCTACKTPFSSCGLYLDIFGYAYRHKLYKDHPPVTT